MSRISAMPRTRTNLLLESLEVRWTPACRTSLTNGLLTLGCDGAADSVTLSLTNVPPDQVVVTHNQTTDRFLLADVRSISFDTGAGNDSVSIVNTIRPAEIRLGDGNDRFEVHALGLPGALLRVSVEGGTGSDTFSVTPRGQNLANLRGLLAIDGGPAPGPARQEDVLNIFDQNGASPAGAASYGISETQLTREGSSPITYQRLSSLVVNTTQRDDIVTVDLPTGNVNQATAVTVQTNGGDDLVMVERVGITWALTVSAGQGTDALLVSPTLQDLGTIRGRLTLDGGGPVGAVPQDALIVYDQNAGANLRNAYTITATAVTRQAAGAALAVNYRNIGYLQVETSDGSDQIRFDLSARLPTTVVVLAGAGDDTFVLTRLPATSLFLDGGRGSDTVDYSAFLTPANPSIYVDLASGFGTGVDGLSEVENVLGSVGPDTLIGDARANRLVGNGGNDFVIGGAGDDFLEGNDGDDYLGGEDGNDILLGGVGDDYLEGGADRDFLIGGRGSDFLTGGDDDDLMIGGFTRYDDLRVALDAILRVWTSRLDYTERVDMIYNGQVPGGYALNERTVACDGSANGLYGEGGLDFFLLTKNDDADLKEKEAFAFVPCP